MTKPTMSSVTSKDSDQPVHPPSMARVLVYPSLDSLEAVEGIVRLNGSKKLHLNVLHIHFRQQ